MAKAKKGKIEYDDKEQSQQFIDKAKELSVDESGKSFEQAIDSIASTLEKDDETKSDSS